MKLFHSVNSGWLIRNGPYTILVDAIHGSIPGFSDLPPDFFDALLDEGEPAPRLCGALFTHKHPDHYDAAKLHLLMQARGPFSVIDECTPAYPGTALLSLGTFNITRFKSIHDGAEYRNVPHVSYLISSGNTALLFPGDADISSTDQFAKVLDTLRPNTKIYAFLNPYQLQSQAAWQIINAYGIEKIIVNHLPREEDDVYDFRSAVNYTLKKMPDRDIIVPKKMCWLGEDVPVTWEPKQDLLKLEQQISAGTTAMKSGLKTGS